MPLRTIVGFHACVAFLGVMAPPPCDAVITDEMASRVGVKRLAAGAEGNHTCFVRADGNVLCWGDNASGQVGDGTAGNVRSTPSRVVNITTAVGVAVGKDHSCAVLATGIVQCWGSNGSGQLGVGSSPSASATPVTVSGLTSVVSIVAGSGFSCARKSDGTVRCWGTNQFGQLGDDTKTGPRFTPVAVSGLVDATKLVAGATHACALRAVGTLVCWGGNGQGQLGTGNTTDRDVPTPVVAMANVTEIAAGLRFTCAARTPGTAFCWGANNVGQLGIGSTSANSLLPVEALSTLALREIAAGETHACHSRSAGQTFCWGGNSAGQTGVGAVSASQSQPQNVRGLASLELAAGRKHTCALAANDVVRCWGDNALGQLGNAGTAAALQPAVVIGLAGSVSARRIAAGTNHSCATRADGALACWGRNDSSAIGDGTTTDRLLPTAVRTDGLPSFQGFLSVAGGGNHNCALAVTSDGSILNPGIAIAPACWGDNRDGEVDPLDANDFVRTPELSSPRSNRVLSAGSFHSCAVNGDNRVRCWGNNDSRQLGTPDTTVSLNDIVEVDAVATVSGGAHSCLLRADGRILCWGSNGFGQLGNGTRIDSATPREVGGITTAVALATQRDHNCALLVTGAVVCWGRNDFGQVDGTLGGDRVVPTPVSGLQTGVAVGVSAGFQHSCALTAGGRVRCWGRNNEGQLGNNSTIDSLAPVEVLLAARTPSALTGVVGLVSDAEHNCALRTTGQPVCWGRNPEGQLGDGTRTRRLAASGVGSFIANVAPKASFATNRVISITALVNCPDDARFFGQITISQGAASASHPFTGACTGGLGEYPLTVPTRGPNRFVAGTAQADVVIVVQDRGEFADDQVWSRAIVLVEAP